VRFNRGDPLQRAIDGKCQGIRTVTNSLKGCLNSLASMQTLYVKLPLLGRGLIMPLSIKALVPLGRATILASAVIVASGILEITGCPLFAAVGKVTLNWAAVRSETEKLRQKITTAACQAGIRSAACQSASDRHASSVTWQIQIASPIFHSTFADEHHGERSG
jgi:phage-related minor tail protein